MLEFDRKRLLCLTLLILKHVPLFVFVFFHALFYVISGFVSKQSEISRLESRSKLLTEELAQAKTTTESLTRTLEDTQDQNKVRKHFTRLIAFESI